MQRGHRFLIGILVVVALAVALTVIATVGQDSLALNGTIYVDADAGGANDGSSWGDAFTDLQDALGDATTGNQIWVAAGTYKPTAEHGGTGDRFRSFQMVNGVAIYGGFDPTVGHTEWEDRDWMAHPTILTGDLDGDDGPDFENNDENSYRVFYHPDGTRLDSSAVLDGFTITGGNANGTSGNEYIGGGMYNYGSSPALANCTFENNWAMVGGGMYNWDGSSPTLINCIFAGNSADDGGGGMYNRGSSPALTNCTFSSNSTGIGGGGMSNWESSPALNNVTFEGNEADSGGGMLNDDSSPTLINCTFEGNSAYKGGGMRNDDSSPTLTNCTFSGNSASYGGGMCNYSSSPTLTHCLFEGNSAFSWAGGMYNDIHSSPALTNCTFSGNSAVDSGGGMYNREYSSPTLTNCSFSGNSARYGGGMYNGRGWPTVTNCILWGDSPNEISGDSPVVTYSDIEGGYPGDGNINEDPLFVDAANGDYHLGQDSPCIDAGDNDAPELPGLDFDREPRILDGDDDGIAIVDMGVDEFNLDWPYSRVHLPLVFRGY